MYANKANILELVSLMLKFEINHIVVCPGSRNAPLSQSFATDKRFTCYSITDERSAAFFALGLTQSLKQAVAICCTSGSALLNILPAVSEAYYQQLPLLVISADRPAEWIGQMDGQTIPQLNMANAIFKKSVHLPEVKDASEAWHCNRMINEALLSLTHHTNGPVHINVPLSEPLFDFSTKELPDARKIDRFESNISKFILSEELAEQWAKATRPLIIAGQQPYDPEISKAIQELSQQKHCVVLTEQISNIKPTENLITNFDSLLHAFGDNEELKPDLVIYFGGHITSKRLKAYIRANKPNHLWTIAPNGEIADTFMCMTALIESQPLPVLHALLGVEKEDSEGYRDSWHKLSGEIEKRSNDYQFSNFSDLLVTKRVLGNLPECNLQLGNSSIIRNTQLFSMEKVREVFCNKGTNGIEGSMSTAVGYAAQSKELTFLMIGDLSFFYDMNALWNEHVSNKLRILVINNGNGQIFNTLPKLENSEIRSKFIAASHHASVKNWAKDRGFQYLEANNGYELDYALPVFCSHEGVQPLVLEVFTDATISENDFKAYYKHLKKYK